MKDLAEDLCDFGTNGSCGKFSLATATIASQAWLSSLLLPTLNDYEADASTPVGNRRNPLPAEVAFYTLIGTAISIKDYPDSGVLPDISFEFLTRYFCFSLEDKLAIIRSLRD